MKQVIDLFQKTSMWQGAENWVDNVQQICCVSQVSGSRTNFCMPI